MLDWNDILSFGSKGNPLSDKRVEKTNEEWRKILTADQYHITREHGTEDKFSGAFCENYGPGKYKCVCCDTLLFDSGEKFDSGTGWPSFTQPSKENAIKYLVDTSWGIVWVEVQCNTCDGHLGHVFADGPAPSGLRYCINSLSLVKEDQSNKIKEK